MPTYEYHCSHCNEIKEIVQKMNQKAQELGLTNTHYMNANGLNAQGHFSSAKDLANLTRYALKNREFAKIVNTVPDMNAKFYATTVFGDIANTDWQGEVSGMGDKVYIRTRPDIESLA